MTERPIENCYWVVPGKVLAGEYPRDLNNAVSKLARLTGAGVTTFIDLTDDRELKPYARLLEGQASHRRFPIRDMSTPHSPELTSAALDAIDDHIRNGEGVAYVHCWGGTGRTGTIVGCWLVRHGRTGEAALARLAELWKTNPKSSRRPVPRKRVAAGLCAELAGGQSHNRTPHRKLLLGSPRQSAGRRIPPGPGQRLFQAGPVDGSRRHGLHRPYRGGGG